MSKQLGFILFCSADAPCEVGLFEHGFIHDVDGQGLCGTDALIGIMAVAHAHHHPVMANDAQMPHQSPVWLPVYHGADHHQRGGIQGQFSADILLHFEILL